MTWNDTEINPPPKKKKEKKSEKRKKERNPIFFKAPNTNKLW